MCALRRFLLFYFSELLCCSVFPSFLCRNIQDDDDVAGWRPVGECGGDGQIFTSLPVPLHRTRGGGERFFRGTFPPSKLGAGCGGLFP